MAPKIKKMAGNLNKFVVKSFKKWREFEIQKLSLKYNKKMREIQIQNGAKNKKWRQIKIKKEKWRLNSKGKIVKNSDKNGA